MYYDIPLQGGTGLGEPLKLILHPLRSSIPICLAALGPKNVALAAEIGDGWLPIFFSPRRMNVYQPYLEEGFRRAGAGKNPASFDVTPTVSIQMGEDLDVCFKAVKPTLALYIGGMGAKGRDFYYNLACRYGYEEAADRIQDLFLQGRKAEASAAVPDALVDEVALCGPKERIAERLAAWRSAGVGTLICATSDLEAVRTMAELAL